MKKCNKLNLTFVTIVLLYGNLAHAMDVVISSNTDVPQIFSSGTDSITINNGVTLSASSPNSPIKGFPRSIANYGTISSNYYALLLNLGGGTMSSFLNDGTISGDFGLRLDNGTITTVTNTGSMFGQYGGIQITCSNDFMNPICNAFITNLNNEQGGLTPLTYSGVMPENYNIIIGTGATTTTGFGKIQFEPGPSMASTKFGISSSSGKVTQLTYLNVISGVTSSNFTNYQVAGTSWGTYLGASWQLLESGSSNWDLNFFSLPIYGPSSADTQASLQASAQKLRSTFNAAAISTNFANMNTYDCNLFDTKGMCISAGGRYTTVDNPNSNSTSAVVVLGYKATPNIRIGGFLDQNVNNNTPAGINISNKNPLMGVFAVWNQNADGLGVQVKLANAYQDKDVNTTRDVIGTSEAGTGATNLNTQSYVGELSYAFRTNQDKTTLRPYLALRQMTIKQDAYTETGVSTPLSYAALKDRSTTALVGLKLNHALTPKATLTASLGIEQDLEHSVDQYSATSSSISGLTSENFNDSIKRTRPVASAGAYYAVSKTQRISGDVYYQQLPFQSTGSTTAYFSYMIGL